MTAKESMVKRKSVRTYKQEPIDISAIESLQSCINEISAPFDTKMRFKILEAKLGDSGKKLGTYGVIKGASNFICTAVVNEERGEENLGYAMEKIILHATSLGLGSCWLAGAFDKAGFSKAMELNSGEVLPIACPIGYSAEHKSFIDKALRTIQGSKNRKDWSEIFFEKDFGRPLTKEAAGRYTDALEMVRIAPSGFNKQPWRIVKDGDNFHFFMEGKKKDGQYSIDRLCIGIAMCHFEMMLNELGMYGKWVDNNPKLANGEGKEYIISFVL